MEIWMASVTFEFPFVILCLGHPIRQGQQRDAQLSPLTPLPRASMAPPSPTGVSLPGAHHVLCQSGRRWLVIVAGWMDVFVDGWVDGWMDVWMDGMEG